VPGGLPLSARLGSSPKLRTLWGLIVALTCGSGLWDVGKCSQRSRRVGGAVLVGIVTVLGMAGTAGAMHVARVVGRYTTKSGEQREYVSQLLRRSFRQDGRVKHETLANLSPLPAAAIGAVRASLAGKTLLVAGEDLELTRSLPHGHVAAVLAQADALGVPALLGPAGRQRDLALALIVGPGLPARLEVGDDPLVDRHHPGRRSGDR